MHGSRRDRDRELQEIAYAQRLAFHAQDAQYAKAMKALDGKPEDEVKTAMESILKLVGAKR